MHVHRRLDAGAIDCAAAGNNGSEGPHLGVAEDVEVEMATMLGWAELRGLKQKREQPWCEAIALAGEGRYRGHGLVHALHLPAVETIELLMHAVGTGQVQF